MLNGRWICTISEEKNTDIARVWFLLSIFSIFFSNQQLSRISFWDFFIFFFLSHLIHQKIPSLLFSVKNFGEKKIRKERNPAYIYIFAAQKINVRKMGISRSVCLYLHLFLILSSCCCCYFCFCCCFCCCYISEMFVFPSQVI